MKEGFLDDRLTCCSSEGDILDILAARLALRLRGQIQPQSLLIGVNGAGAELGEKIAQELLLPFEALSIRPVCWPPSSLNNHKKTGNIIGSVCGDNDIVYLDDVLFKASGASLEAIMSHVQSIKLQCIKEAAKRTTPLNQDKWKAGHLFFIVCTHASGAIIEAALQSFAQKSPQSISLVIPFVLRSKKRDLEKRVDTIVCLKEFEKDDSLYTFADQLSRLTHIQVKSELD